MKITKELGDNMVQLNKALIGRYGAEVRAEVELNLGYDIHFQLVIYYPNTKDFVKLPNDLFDAGLQNAIDFVENKVIDSVMEHMTPADY